MSIEDDEATLPLRYPMICDTLYLGGNTTWYLHSHRVCAKLPSSIWVKTSLLLECAWQLLNSGKAVCFWNFSREAVLNECLASNMLPRIRLKFNKEEATQNLKFELRESPFAFIVAQAQNVRPIGHFAGFCRWSLIIYRIAAHWYTYEMAEISDFVCASLINKRISAHWCTCDNAEITGFIGNHWRIIRFLLIDAHTKWPDSVDFVCDHWWTSMFSSISTYNHAPKAYIYI